MPVRQALRDFAGELLLPDDAAFDEARRVENDIVDRRPALIARCAGPADVAAALRHARATGLPVTVRSGGHGPDGFAVADDALVVDLTPMRAVAVDPARRIARVQGGATWRELDAATGAHGLAVTGARIPSVGVAGFTLGSGSGWLERKLGLAADRLRSARVVTAAGDVVHTSATENPDLFWALRGGGPSFGVVASLDFELAPVGDVLGGLLAWPLDRVDAVAATYAELMAGAPDDLGGAMGVMTGPPFVPPGLQGTPIVAIVVLWTGAGEPPIAPLLDLQPEARTLGAMPYARFQHLFESPEPYTARIRGEGAFLSGLPPAAVAVLAEHHARKPVAMGSMLVQPMGGAFARAGGIPLGHRDARWALQIGAAWFDPAQDAAVREWAAGLRAALAPWTAGEPYPNFMPEANPGRLRTSYGAEVWERLRAIRAAWDPEGVLAAGHAIPRE
jgi:FAD/FMN-containing dehydrogenase